MPMWKKSAGIPLLQLVAHIGQPLHRLVPLTVCYCMCRFADICQLSLRLYANPHSRSPIFGTSHTEIKYTLTHKFSHTLCLVMQPLAARSTVDGRRKSTRTSTIQRHPAANHTLAHILTRTHTYSHILTNTHTYPHTHAHKSTPSKVI